MWSVKVTNDGKEKHNSFQAQVEFEHFTGPTAVLHVDGWITAFEVVGLGATEAEARENLNDLMGALKAKIFGM